MKKTGSSTPFPFIGITSPSQCQCLPGYYRSNQSQQQQQPCIPCGLNWHRTAHMIESACQPCPSGMVTPTTTSANCYCKAGSYMNATSQICSPCKAGSYCEGDSNIVQCPLHSMSKEGSKTRSDCQCEPGKYYGSLALPGSECMLLPFAQKCEQGGGNNICSCASGWIPIYNYSSATNNNHNGLTMRCIVECALGEYARIDPITFAKVCMLDSLVLFQYICQNDSLGRWHV